MNESLISIQDLEFTAAAESVAAVVGGLSIACRSIEHGDWGGCFPQPRPLPHPVRPIHLPILDLPHPRPLPFPKHIRDLAIVSGPITIRQTNH
jgi:hypothetical protein